MIRPGDTLENPVTGERLTFRRTATETNGAEVLVETAVRPDGFVAAAHLHPYQTERFEGPLRDTRARARTRNDHRPPRRDAHDRARHSTQVLERGGERAALRRRDHAGARVRVADRDDVWPRRGRQDQPQGPAERAPARRDRQGAFRHGAAAISAGSPSAARTHARRTTRPRLRLPADLRARPARSRAPRRPFPQAFAPRNVDQVHVMSAKPYLFLAGVLGEQNRTAHQHNPSMNTRRWRNGS